jgi:Mg2+-importing ATPase
MASDKAGGHRLHRDIALSAELADASRCDPAVALQRLNCAEMGLDGAEAAARLARFGANRVAEAQQPSVIRELLGRARNPLNTLLLTLAVVSYALGDVRAAVVIAGMVVLSIMTAFVQEHRSNQAAARLRALVKTTASVRRCGDARPDGKVDGFVEIPMEEIVPGDIVALSAGDMIPADLRLLSAKDLFVNQSTLTGEAMPVEKSAAACGHPPADAFDLPNICFMGSNVVSGYGTGAVVHTGDQSYFGRLADTIAGQRVQTNFEKGIDRFTWLMIRFIAVLVPAVFLINGFGKGDWFQALLFALAVAVGLTPEMLPMIVTTNLAKGAIAMSAKRVIVKRLHAIQNFGAMDVLCTDKTGTLTQDRIILKRHLDIRGKDCDRVLEYAYLNSHYQSGLKNLLDVAVLQHVELGKELHDAHQYRKIDEIPFDFVRRRLTVVLGRDDGRHVLICKGAIEEVYAVCTRYEIDGEVGLLDPGHLETAKRESAALNADGFRVIAVAYKELDAPPSGQRAYTVADECDLTLLGYIAFLDPPKDSAGPAIAALGRAGVRVKIVTGDNDVVTRKVCRDVGLDAGRIILGSEIEAMNDATLAQTAETCTVFAKVSPAQKARIIAACQRGGHVVGFLGDGINDSAALKTADVGISVDTAVDIAKESADIILLEKNLGVLGDGVIEGRKVFGNITKYIKMGASSNFGNMFSVVGASLMLPFLPMAPIQVLTNNLLYDFSQTAIPTDNVDEDYLLEPRRWDIDNIMKFMLFIGPISSVFDYVTFFTMIVAFGAWTNPALFQTGWFVESLLTQTLIIHIIRTAKIPFVESRASPALMATSLVICIVGVVLPFTWLGASLGFVPLPPPYWPAVIAIIACYAALTHLVKTWFVRRWGM